MLLRVAQRLVRMSPRLARLGWAAVPARLRRLLEPVLHPIAAGARGGGFVLGVPEALAPRSWDVVLASDAVAERARGATRRAGLEGGGHRVLVAAPQQRLSDLAREQAVTDAVYVSAGEGDAERERDAARLGFRVVRADGLDGAGALEEAFPPVTIVVVTHSNAAVCAECCRSLRRNTPWPRLEILVVDNGSRDGTRAMLDGAARRDSRVTVLTNAENLGFARAANQGLRRARGDVVVLLNDDTVVGPGWLSRLVAQLDRDPSLGLVCPATNEIGNAAKIDVDYGDFAGMEGFALARAARHAGERLPMESVALFCAAARRPELESAGLLDERYAVGMFEDDDLSMTLRRKGRTLAVALDSFVHHVGHASFARLPDAEYLAIWEANRRRFEEKWQVKWTPPGERVGT